MIAEKTLGVKSAPFGASPIVWGKWKNHWFSPPKVRKMSVTNLFLSVTNLLLSVTNSKMGQALFFSPFQNHLRLTFSIASSFKSTFHLHLPKLFPTNSNTLGDTCEQTPDGCMSSTTFFRGTKSVETAPVFSLRAISSNHSKSSELFSTKRILCLVTENDYFLI